MTALPAETDWRAEPHTNLKSGDNPDWWHVMNEDGDTMISHLDEPTARLIAAAPELADALAKANAVLSGIGESWPDFFTGKSVALARVPEDVKAALAKAGRAPQ